MSHDHTSEHHGHHDHNDLTETLELTRSRQGRRRLAVAGLGNAAIGIAAFFIAQKGGASPTVIESIHDAGDTAYYAVPWLMTRKRHFNAPKAILWMKRTAYGAAGLAGASSLHAITEAVLQGAEPPKPYTVFAQLFFAAANGGIAFYVGAGEKDGSVIDSAAKRHAAADAKTSMIAAAGNAAAHAFAPLNPAASAVVAAVTIRNERTTIIEADEALETE